MADETPCGESAFAVLDEIVEQDQTWPVLAAKYGVENPLPPWKTSLDGLCDVLDRTCYPDGRTPLTFKERRDEEDELSAGRYADLPFPENQLVALAYSLLARGIISEDELRRRLDTVRARLEA
ncbi:thiocyanate hydrolase [Mycobacterium sp. ML4]